MKAGEFTVRFLAGVVTVFMVISYAEAEEKIQYRLKFKEGQSYYIKRIFEQKVAQLVNGQEEITEQKTGFGYDFEVREVEDGNAWINCTYKWVGIKQKGTKGEVLYDSSQKQSRVPLAAQGLAALVGESFYLKMTPLGEIEDIRGLDVMYSYIKSKIAGGAAKGLILSSIEQHLSEAGVKKFVEDSMAMYPEESVGLSDSWSKEIVTLKLPRVVTKKKWTLKDRKDGIGIIELNSIAKSDPNTGLLDSGGTARRYEMLGEGHGLIKIKESTGQIIHSEFTQDISGTVTVQNKAEIDNVVSMPVKIYSTITFTMSERQKEASPRLNL